MATALPLQRHQLACLSDAGWQRQLARPWDGEARECLDHWAARRLPLVVTTQPTGPDGSIALGLPAPGRWARRRLVLCVAREDILYFDAFPPALQAQPLMPIGSKAAWGRLCNALQACGVAARIYGSHGWQLITGLDHLRSGSDADLCIGVAGPTQADAVAACLLAFPKAQPRLDGELLFANGAAVAWREWSAWRAGRGKAVMVKRLAGAALERAPFWPAPQAAEEQAAEEPVP